MIAFSCFQCNKPLQIKDEYAGKKAKCPHCAATILIPTSSVSNPALPAGSGTRVLPDKPPAKKKPALEETLGEKSASARHDEDTLPPQAAGLPGYEFLAPPQAADEIGRLGSYRVLKVLGSGGMGVVFLAEDAKLDRLVALKAMKPSQAAAGDARTRFIREAKATAAIKHDHIVVIHQVDEDRGAPFLAMELLEGEPLNERIQRESILPLSEVLRIGRETAEGLAAAHQRGLIHRDVKPANIWLEGERGRVKILDFGLARITADDTRLTQDGAIVGTPAYMAPEQAQAQPLDARCDLFSLGCVLYSMCTGQLPFKGGDTISLLLALVTETPQPPHEVNADVPPELSRLILQLLAKKRDDRPASAKAVVQAIREIENAQTQPLAALQPPKPSRKRRRWPFVAAVMIVVLAVGAGAAGLYLNRRGVPTLPSSTRPATVEERLNAVADLPAEKQVAEVAALLKELNPDFDGKATPKIENGVVTELAFVTDKVTDLTPVRSLPGLLALTCNGSAPGKGKLANLTALKDLQLTELNCEGTQVADLSPLKDLKLKRLNIADTAVTDLSPLAEMPLQQIRCDLKADRDAEILRGIKSLEQINDKTAAAFWKERDAKAADLDAWVKSVAAMKAESQVEAVIKKLRELNPGFDSKINPQYLNGAVVEIRFVSDRVTDLSPLRALTKLQTLFCNSTLNAKGKLVDLAPLKDLPLVVLHCQNTLVMDLSPLKDMKLKGLDCANTRVADLSPLKFMMLGSLNCSGTQVADLTPLKGMPLHDLLCDFKCERDLEIIRPIKTLQRINGKRPADFWKEVDAKKAEFEVWRKPIRALKPHEQVAAVAKKLVELNPGFDGKVTHKHDNGVVTELTIVSDNVTDLGAVRALPGLKDFNCAGSGPGRSRLSDLSPLAALPLTRLDCNSTQVYDLSPLNTAKLTFLACSHTQVSDLTPLRGMPLTVLRCAYTPLSDLTPLKDFKLTGLSCNNTKVTDLTPLKGMPLTFLFTGATGVSDLTPLKDMPLREFHCAATPVADLTPLRGLPLATLGCFNTQVVDLTPLKDLKLTTLRCDVKCERDTEILRSIKSLERINDKPAADYWKDADARHAEYETWRKSVAALKPEEQFASVMKELQHLNPDFDGKELHGIDLKTRVVTDLTFNADHVTDLSPLRALTGLKSLTCAGGSGKGRLSDLSPLKDLKLTSLDCTRSHVFDLSPLKGMPLKSLKCGMTLVKDLTPLKGMKLTTLRCGNAPVSDLTPLNGMPLGILGIQHTKATDLTPLREMPLTELNCDGIALTNLSPLKGHALKVISLDYKRERDADILHGLKSLEQINGKTPADFWKEVEGK